MMWGMGLEHEVQYFYLPTSVETDKKYPPTEIVLFESNTPATSLAQNLEIVTESEKELLDAIDYERTGRKCMGKVILKRIPVYMPEFITRNPFSDIDNPKTIENYYKQLLEKEAIFEKIMENKFKLIQYPFGMCSNISIRKNYLSSSFDLIDEIYRDYVGSFHYTITLPFEKKNIYTEKFEEISSKIKINSYTKFGLLFYTGRYNCEGGENIQNDTIPVMFNDNYENKEYVELGLTPGP